MMAQHLLNHYICSPIICHHYSISHLTPNDNQQNINKADLLPFYAKRNGDIAFIHSCSVTAFILVRKAVDM